MLCESCKLGKHSECTNIQTCPCQHRKTKLFKDGTITPLSERDYHLDTNREAENMENLNG